MLPDADIPLENPQQSQSTRSPENGEFHQFRDYFGLVNLVMGFRADSDTFPFEFCNRRLDSLGSAADLSPCVNSPDSIETNDPFPFTPLDVFKPNLMDREDIINGLHLEQRPLPSSTLLERGSLSSESRFAQKGQVCVFCTQQWRKESYFATA